MQAIPRTSPQLPGIVETVETYDFSSGQTESEAEAWRVSSGLISA
jgi:hypothetical protein